MYTKTIPFKDYKGKPRNQDVHFMLEVRDVGKLLTELSLIFSWQASIDGPERELSTEEVQEFYTAFEKVLLEAWGEPSEDGLYFRRSGRFDFEESKLFAATMEMFISEPSEATKLINEVLPPDMVNIVKKQSENLEKMAANPENSEEIKAQIVALQEKLETASGGQTEIAPV